MAPGLSRLHRDARGAGLVEYLMLVGLVGLLALAAFRHFGQTAQAKIEGQARCVEALDAGCGKGNDGVVPSRAQVVDGLATEHAPSAQALAGAGAEVASTGLAARLLGLLRHLDPIGRAQAADAPPPSPAAARVDANEEGRRIADAVVTALRRTEPYSEIGNPRWRLAPRSWLASRDLWGISWGNELPGALLQSPPASHWGRRSETMAQPDACGANCRTRAERDFGIRECQSQADCTTGTCTGVAAAGASLCTGHSDFLYDEVYRTFVAAERTVTFATFGAPNEGYTAAIRNALTELHNRQPPGGRGMDVRLLIGEAPDGNQPTGTNVRSILADLTRDLPADSPIRVTVATYGGAPASWNHAKMIVADGREALVGGHNWWTNDYNRTNPVHDVSLRLRGPAARHAEAYFEPLWAYALSGRRHASRGTGVPHAAAPVTQGTPGEGVPVISVGVPGGTTANLASGVAGDTALMTMIRSARRTVRLSQQELVSQQLAAPSRQWVTETVPGALGRRAGDLAASALAQHIDPRLLDELALAMMRGVRVEVVLTGLNPATSTDGYSHGWSTEQTRQAVIAHLRANLPRLQRMQRQPVVGGASMDEVANNLEIRELRFSDEDNILVNGQPEPLRNHAKVLIVDDAAAYVGSQNMYPGGLAGQRPMTQLAEFGYIFLGETVHPTIVRDYWDRMWPLARGRPDPG
jgi:phosphatidylserine/phosphatidylglycerophosphate/cardiolipin synthase-like enzyme